MRFENALDLMLVHCQGELGHVLMNGAPEIPGATMLDKMNHINTVDDSLRRFVTFEPRAHVAQSVNLLLAPVRKRACARRCTRRPCSLPGRGRDRHWRPPQQG